MTGGSRYGVVICGGGPAGTGIVVRAAADGRLAELLSRGLCLVEQEAVLGPGALGHHPITANTRGGSFLQHLEAVPSHPLFAQALAEASTQDLARLRDAFPRLPLVARYLESVGRAVGGALGAASGCTVLTGHRVREVRLLPGGGVSVTADPRDGRVPVAVTSDHAVLALGGRPRGGLEDLTLLPGLGLAGYRDRLCHAAAVLDERVGLPPALRRAVASGGEVVIVGGSHSAWSTAWRLVHDPALRDAEDHSPRVTVLHRSPLRFYFEDVTQARAAGYDVDEALEVCPRTGAVNRHGGLRADAHALAWTATHPARGQGRVRALLLEDEPESRAAAVQALDRSHAVIAAVGYEANVPRLRWPDGRPLTPASDEAGQLLTDGARLVSADGTVLPELLALGLGAGPRASGELSGEPSYLGRLDAVSLYQHEVGRVVLDALLGAAHS